MAGETILIVEDSPVSLKLVAAVLRGEGYKIHIASTAEQALSTLGTIKPHLMLVDIGLPGMSGLEKLAHAFSDPRLAGLESTLPDFIVQGLDGKRIALIGFAELEAVRMCTALGSVGAKPRLFEANDPPDYPPIRDCNLAMIHVRPETLNALWLTAEFLAPPLLPLVIVGGRHLLLSLDPAVQSRAREFLIDSWQPEEALMRLCLALSRTSASIPVPPAIATGPSRELSGATTQLDNSPAYGKANIVIADDDVTVRTLVRSALENEGMQCQLASNGPDALQLLRDHQPHAAVLDVNMPGMDGFEVLAAVRAEALPVRIILLTARQHQNDIVRGFSLGTDDYIIKPFKLMELVVRVKRLLAC